MEFAAQPPSRHAQYGEHWGEGAARCFSLEADILDEDHAVRLMPVPDSFVCPISAAIMIDPVATVDGCVYERPYIERWFRERRQQGHRITSPITGLELPSATLMPLVALQHAIEAYLAHRPELKREHMAGRSFEEAAQILQTDLFEKQAVHASTQDKLKRLKQANRALLRALQETEERLRLETERKRENREGEAGDPVAAERSEAQPQVLREGLGSEMPHPNDHEGDEGLKQPRQKAFEGSRSKATPKAERGLMALLPWILLLCSLLAQLRNFGSAKAAMIASASIGSTDVSPDAHRSSVADNPAFAGQLEKLQSGSQEEKQRAVFMLRIFAAEHPENQVAIARSGAITSLVRLLEDSAPVLREESARTLWNLARNNKEINFENQVAIGRSGAIRQLVRLLSDAMPRVRVVAAAVLNDLASDNVENQIMIAREGAIGPLVQLLRDEVEAPAIVMAASLLKSLAANNGDRQVALALISAVQPLVSLLKADTLLAQEQAASTLCTLAAFSTDMQAAIARAGAVGPLVQRLREDMMQGTAALALRNLADSHPENQLTIIQAGAVLPLVKLLDDGMPGVREEAARALWNLAQNHLDTQVAIVRAGAAIPLVALLKGDSQEQATLTLLSLNVE